jgi:hypothetical protein
MTDPGLPAKPEPSPDEEWRAVPGVAGLRVSSLGRVQRYYARGGWSRMHFVSPGLVGYCRFTHNKKLTSVHHAVCLAFHGPRPSKLHTPDHVAKYDGDWMRERSDNRACNLRWATKSDQSLNRKPESADRSGKPVFIKHESWEKTLPPLRFPSTLAAGKFLGVGSSHVSAARKHGRKVHGFSVTAADSECQENLPGEEWRRASDKLYVSSMGRVQLRDKVGAGWGLRLTPKPTSGRLYVRVLGDVLVHRLVATLFCGEQPSAAHTVNHINGQKDDNRACNLRWATKRVQVLSRAKQASHTHEKRPIEVTAPDTTTWVRHDSRMDAVRAIYKSAGVKLSPGSMFTCASKGYRYKGYRFRLV